MATVLVQTRREDTAGQKRVTSHSRYIFHLVLEESVGREVASARHSLGQRSMQALQTCMSGIFAS